MTTGQTVSENSAYPRLLLRTLGPLELIVHPEGEEERLVPAAGKALALLAYLACAPMRSAYRERLTELLWATSSTESGLQSLRQVRLTLRRLVGAEVVIPDGEALALAPSVRVDRDDFLGHLAAKRLDEAIRLYRGPLCDRFAAAGAEDFERWVGAERTSLQSHAVEAIDRLATVALNEARVSDALALATRLREAEATTSGIGGSGSRRCCSSTTTSGRRSQRKSAARGWKRSSESRRDRCACSSSARRPLDETESRTPHKSAIHQDSMLTSPAVNGSSPLCWPHGAKVTQAAGPVWC